jgi:membrane-associated phospholipid phosphatase
MTPVAIAVAGGERNRPWGRAALWLLGLAPLFYLTYGAANHLAAGRADVPAVVFGWERQIPFLAWTILPYWSINAFYGASLFVCSTRAELDTHGRRLLTAQAIAVTCFLFFPLRFSFARPEIAGGWAGFMFDALLSFDKPYNQAPSLHIALLVILWVLYARHMPPWARRPLNIWFALIGASVLTTYQHHFVDIPTGALAGFLCLWVWPDEGASPLASLSLTDDPQRRRLALRYAGGALAFALLAMGGGGWLLWLAWPAVSLLMVAGCYALFGPAGFQKDQDGRLSVAARWLFAPYHLAAFVNSRLWTRDAPSPVPVAEGVWLGRIPGPFDPARPCGFIAIVDVCAELPASPGGACVLSVPMLDLVSPSPAQLAEAAGLIEEARLVGPVLVCCALGYSRSAAALAAWALRTHRARTAEEAVAFVRRARPSIVLDAVGVRAIAAAGEGQSSRPEMQP